MNKFQYSWDTRILRSLFLFRDTIIHKVNLIYKRTCTSKKVYNGETKRNLEVRWNKHCSVKKTSEIRDHLEQ